MTKNVISRSEARQVLGRAPRYGDRVWEANTTPPRVLWRSWARPDCSDDVCEEKADVDWKDDHRDPETWFYRECDFCGEYFCAECAEREEHEDGCVTTCNTCASNPHRKVA